MKKRKRITFGKVKVQKLNRIVLPQALLENMDIDVGNEVELFLDLEKEKIIVEKVKNDK